MGIGPSARQVAQAGWTTQLVRADQVRAGDELQVVGDDVRWALVVEVEAHAGLVRVALAGGDELTLEASREVLVTFAGEGRR